MAASKPEALVKTGSSRGSVTAVPRRVSVFEEDSKPFVPDRFRHRKSIGTVYGRKSMLRKTETERFEQPPPLPNPPQQRRQKRFNFLDHMKLYARMARESIIKTKQAIGQDDKMLIFDALKRSFIFKDLSDNDINIVIACMFHCTVDEGQFVFKQGDIANSFFVIKSGVAEVIANERLIKTLESPKYFGETALLYNAPRNASIRAQTELELFGMDRGTFQKMIRQVSNRMFDQSFACLQRATIFDCLSQEQKRQLAENVIVEKYADGETIVHQGARANSFYIIKAGEVVCVKDGQVVARLAEGATFGEQALVEEGQRAVAVRAKSEVEVLALSSNVLEKVLGGTLADIKNKNVLIWAIEAQPAFQKLTAFQKLRWFQLSKFLSLDGSTVLKRRDQPITQFYLVLEGEMQYGEKTFRRGDFFDVQTVSPTVQPDRLFEHNLVTVNAKLMMLSLEDMQGILSNWGPLEAAGPSPQASETEGRATHRLSDLLFLKYLGEGQLGKVSLVGHRSTRKLFALKMVMKDDVNEFGLQEAMVNEKGVLAALDHPLTLRLHGTFSDEKAVYLLTDFVQGLELFELIRQVDFLNNADARFYVANALLALEYLHLKRIVHRDVKPENLMVDERGYLRLIDFGTAKQLTNDRGRTQTIIGTPHYMAPEVLTGKGYSFHVDLWSLGVCMYEFMCGMVPFGEDSLDPYEIYKIIIEGELRFPDGFESPDNATAVELMTRLMDRIPESRLGGSFESLKAHGWFDGFEWQSVAEQRLKAPNLPSTEHLLSEEDVDELFDCSRPLLSHLEVS